MNKINKNYGILGKCNIESNQISFGFKTALFGLFISVLIFSAIATFKDDYVLNVLLPVDIFIGNFFYGIFVSSSKKTLIRWLILAVIFWLLAANKIFN